MAYKQWLESQPDQLLSQNSITGECAFTEQKYKWLIGRNTKKSNLDALHSHMKDSMPDEQSRMRNNHQVDYASRDLLIEQKKLKIQAINISISHSTTLSVDVDLFAWYICYYHVDFHRRLSYL